MNKTAALIFASLVALPVFSPAAGLHYGDFDASLFDQVMAPVLNSEFAYPVNHKPARKDSVLEKIGREYEEVVNEALPSVVMIDVEAQLRAIPEKRRFWRPDWLGRKDAESDQPNNGSTGASGSGFVVDADRGLIFTNAHVVDLVGRNGKLNVETKDRKITTVDVVKSSVMVIFHDGKSVPAKVIDFNTRLDLALIQVDPKEVNLAALPIGRTSGLYAGQPVVAVGSPMGLRETSTFGFVSNSNKMDQESVYVDFIQHSAPVNPGNSGGPLLDIQGHVIGINSQIISENGGFVGVSLAIPAELIRERLDMYYKSGHINASTAGMKMAPNGGAVGGLLIVEINPRGPNAAAGFKPGDVIVALNGKSLLQQDDPSSIKATKEFARTISNLPPGSHIPVGVRRGELLIDLDLATEAAAD